VKGLDINEEKRKAAFALFELNKAGVRTIQFLVFGNFKGFKRRKIAAGKMYENLPFLSTCSQYLIYFANTTQFFPSTLVQYGLSKNAGFHDDSLFVEMGSKNV
jgi:hypothetical protein